jgi:quaternary ammonium compound-resistance protein SugE
LAWIYILIAAAFETAWTFSVKYMKFAELKSLTWNTFYNPQLGLPVILPFAGYIIFGIGNIYFFSMAIKQMPVATAYAVWTALTLILVKAAGMTFLSEKVVWPEVFFMALIMTGILGMKYVVVSPG